MSEWCKIGVASQTQERRKLLQSPISMIEYPMPQKKGDKGNNSWLHSKQAKLGSRVTTKKKGYSEAYLCLPSSGSEAGVIPSDFCWI